MEVNKDQEQPQLPKKEPLKIKIEDNFSTHLRMMKLDPAKMMPFHLLELKKAFYAGMAHLIGIQNYVVEKHSQEEAGKVLDDIAKQVDDYLIKVVKK